MVLEKRRKHGVSPVVQWGVFLWLNRNVSNSCFQLRPSLIAACVAFLITRLIRSICPFARGYNGRVLVWVIPLILRKDSIILDVNCSRLSLVSVSGEPCTEKILNNLEIMVAEVVLFKISTNGNRE